MHEICARTFFKGTFMCAPNFLVCAHLTTCALENTRTCSFEGILICRTEVTWSFDGREYVHEHLKFTIIFSVLTSSRYRKHKHSMQAFLLSFINSILIV